jgi:cell division protein FtsL
MSYKDELRRQIEELEKQVDSDKTRLNSLYQELHTISIKERTESTVGFQQLLKG